MRSALANSFAYRLKSFGFSLFLVLLLAPLVGAQTQITTGTIQGMVSDANGAVLPGANIEIKNLDTNISKTLSSDEGGRFVALALPPGNYSVTVSKPGFGSLVLEKVELNVGQAITLPLSMKV